MSNKTIREAWAFGRDHLAQASFNPRLDARLLLEHVLNANHSHLVAHGDELLTAEQEVMYASLLSRAARKEPIPYITGGAPFYGMEFLVNPSVLIPRPETEALVERAVAWSHQRSQDSLQVVDVGTGSGCIAVTLSCHLSKARIVAVDSSVAALRVARLNARRLATKPIHFVQGDLLLPFRGPFDLIVANLPYVAGSEWTEVDDGVKWYEPHEALDGGPDGLFLIRRLLQQASSRLSRGGTIFLEIGWQQGPAVRQLVGEMFTGARVSLSDDFAGHDRLVQILAFPSGLAAGQER